jgi:hypothetical protein
MRRRSGSIVKMEEVGDRSVEEVLDRSAFVNLNANWVDAKGVLGHLAGAFRFTHYLPSGAWLIHVVLITVGKIIIDNIPGISQQISWTLVNLLYLAVRSLFLCVIIFSLRHFLYVQLTYLMFHWVTGIPFENHGGAYDELTLWEQIDDGAHYTPAKKWLISVPILL